MTVYFDKARRKWRAEVNKGGTRVRLGRFESKEEALAAVARYAPANVNAPLPASPCGTLVQDSPSSVNTERRKESSRHSPRPRVPTSLESTSTPLDRCLLKLNKVMYNAELSSEAKVAFYLALFPQIT